MNLFILNPQYEKVAYFDSYKSLEWAERYNESGDFVFSIAATPETTETIKKRMILQREDTGRICIIESIDINLTQGENILTAKGRGAESVLARRVIWTQTVSNSSETAEDFIRRLITENAINPTIIERKIPELILGERQGFTDVISMQITGDNLLTAISNICKIYNYGFRIILNTQNKLEFQLYKGVDRSYNQSALPYVVFSDTFDNLMETEYQTNETNYKNVALIGGEGEGTARRYQTIGEAAGLDRYELFVDAKDISSNEGEIVEADYNKLLQERGKEKLSECETVEEYSGLIDTVNTYVYRQDYNLGDVVQIENQIGIRATPRITEVLESQNENGYKIVPTFGDWRAENGSKMWIL